MLLLYIPSPDGCLGCFGFRLLRITLLWISVYNILGDVFLFILGKYTGVELIDHR